MIKVKVKLLIIVNIILVLYSINASSELYKWIDENGVVNYTESKPQNTKSESLDLPPIPKNHTNTKIFSDEDINRIFGKESKKNKLKKQEAVQSCLEMQDMIKFIDLKVPIYKDEINGYHFDGDNFSRNYKGNRSYIADKEKPKVLRKVKDKFNSDCVNYKQEIQVSKKKREKNFNSIICKKLRKKLKHLKNPDSHTSNSDIYKFESYKISKCGKK